MKEWILFIVLTTPAGTTNVEHAFTTLEDCHRAELIAHEDFEEKYGDDPFLIYGTSCVRDIGELPTLVIRGKKGIRT